MYGILFNILFIRRSYLNSYLNDILSQHQQHLICTNRCFRICPDTVAKVNTVHFK